MVKRLILILIAAIWLPLRAAVPADGGYVLSESPAMEYPQWSDVGLHDVLAVTGGSNVAPPTTVRVVHDNPTGTTPTTSHLQARHYSTFKALSCSHLHTISGYIYLIRCLRL